MNSNNNEAILKQLGIRWKALAAYCEQVHLNATVEDWQYFVLGMEELISNLKAILPSDAEDDDAEDDDAEDDVAEDDDAEDDDAEDDDAEDDDTEDDDTEDDHAEDGDTEDGDTEDDHAEDDHAEDDEADTEIAVADSANTNSMQFLSFRCFANAFPECVKSRKPIRERYSQELKKQTIREFTTDHDRINMTLSNAIRRYEKSLCDVSEIFARVSFGESLSDICRRWVPPLGINEIELLFHQIMATTPNNFRKECIDFAKKWLFDSIKNQFFEYLRIETSNKEAYSESQRSAILNQICSVLRHDLQQPPEEVGDFLQWPDPSVKAKLTEKILEFRRRVQFIIRNSAYYRSLDDGTRSMLNQRLMGTTLAGIGKDLRLTRERVRQKIKVFTNDDPLVSLFFTIREKRDYGPNDSQVSQYKQDLIDEFVLMPEGFFAHGFESDLRLERRPEESKKSYVRRLFGIYMRGAFSKSVDEKFVESTIQISRGDRRRYYARMLDYSIQEYCEEYEFVIRKNQVNYYISKAGFDSNNNILAENILKFLSNLVCFPKQPAHILCREAGLENTIGRKIQSLFFDEVLEESRRRAREALSISDRINARIPFSEKMLAVIQSRYLKQLSIAETCREIGIQTSQFAIIDSRLRKAIPSLALITPRRSMRK
jgi:hypothetical protein